MPGQDSWIYRGGIPTLDAWPCGLRRRIDPSPVEERLEADLDALRDESHDHRVSRFGSLLDGTQESHASAWSISSSGPKSRALCSALCEIRPPWRPCGRDIRHTLNQPGKLPFSSPPRRATVSRSPTWPACPLTESYLIRSEKTRDKDLKERRDLDHQAHFFPAPPGSSSIHELTGSLPTYPAARSEVSRFLRMPLASTTCAKNEGPFRTSSRLPAARGGRAGSRRRTPASCPGAGGPVGGRRQLRRPRSRRRRGLRRRCRAGLDRGSRRVASGG